MKDIRVKKSPGAWLFAVAQVLYNHTDVEQVFRPLLADWHAEYFVSLKEGKLWKARWISARYYLSFSQAIGSPRLVIQRTPGRSKRAPGSRTLSLVRSLFPTTDIDQVYEQIIRNWEEEHRKALDKGQIWMARLKTTYYIFKFLQSVIMKKGLVVWDLLVRAFRAVIRVV
jgi:hypothetical protein